MNDKVIVTNLSALRKKYGAGLEKIKLALDKLIAADKERGLKTRLVALDDKAAMKKLDAPVVKDAKDPKENKQAIDGVYHALTPEYLMILGAIDVVPHQDLTNPVFDGSNDPDAQAFGDLPYACEAPYSRKPQDFVGPTRVLGRLPDITGSSDPAYLVGLLATSAGAKQLPAKEYAAHLGISAKVWQKSTHLSLSNLFGTSADLHTAPADGPKWKEAMLKRRSHFINCHGALADPFFYGQSGSDFPQAHSAAFLAGKLTEGTVAAVECCYGAELYDPQLIATKQMGIGNTYLGSKAYGYLGSTTIAYGPAEGNGAADLLCQFFLKAVLAGASLGRAALEARQEFAGHAPALDPVDLKTLAQFNLLGDPSLQPVQVETPHQAMAAKGVAAKTVADQLPSERAARREQLAKRGLWLARHQSVARPVATAKAAAKAFAAKAEVKAPAMPAPLRRLASEAGLEAVSAQTFEVAPKAQPKGLALAAKSQGAVRLHVLLGQRKDQQAPEGVTPTVALVAKEVDGKVVSYRELLAK